MATLDAHIVQCRSKTTTVFDDADKLQCGGWVGGRRGPGFSFSAHVIPAVAGDIGRENRRVFSRRYLQGLNGWPIISIPRHNIETACLRLMVVGSIIPTDT
jgi:hypothetical protein